MHSLSQSGQAIYSLRPSTLAQLLYALQQQNSLLITKKEAINKRKYLAFISQVNRAHESKAALGRTVK